ncbi:DUF3320 domain-containing protein [Lichenicoccus roseus]|uniref:DUF3320 domain-containing protein n=1 Tax=Lichenicoccus roseus TaxID=2683649 RepID=A0A5R9J2N9_9PROT|nr:DUF3320 domain-containing protein [Lichenicoccus roseus]
MQARFFDFDYLPTLRSIIFATLRQRGPLRKDVLVQVMSRQHGFGRARKDNRETMITAVVPDLDRTTEEVGVFVWPRGSPPSNLLPIPNSHSRRSA